MKQEQPKAIPGKKRLLVVSQHFWPETFRINDIVEGFTQDEIEVDVLCGLPNYPKGEWFEGYSFKAPREEKYAGAAVFRCGEIRRKGNTSLRIFLNYVSFPFFSLFNLHRLKGRRYDAVFCYETSPVLMMLPAIVYAKNHKIPLTTYVLDLWPENLYSVLPLKNKFLRKIAQSVSNWHYKRSARLIAMSNALAQHLQTITSSAKIKPEITVIPQYCEDFYADEIFDETLKIHFQAPFTIMFAGNLSPAQDIENLIEALALARQKDEAAQKIHCLIVGDGMSREKIEIAIKEKGLQGCFTFAGQQPATDMPKWTGYSDALFAGLAKSENLGHTVPAKITSYLAAAKPLLVAADGEAAKASLESGAALVSPAGNAELLSENILHLLHSNKATRLQMGQNGRKCYEENYKRSKLLAQLKHFIFSGLQ